MGEEYKEMYLNLFSEISRAIEILQNAQAEAERVYMEAEESKVVQLKIIKNEEE